MKYRNIFQKDSIGKMSLLDNRLSPLMDLILFLYIVLRSDDYVFFTWLKDEKKSEKCKTSIKFNQRKSN